MGYSAKEYEVKLEERIAALEAERDALKGALREALEILDLSNDVVEPKPSYPEYPEANLDAITWWSERARAALKEAT